MMTLDVCALAGSGSWARPRPDPEERHTPQGDDMTAAGAFNDAPDDFETALALKARVGTRCNGPQIATDRTLRAESDRRSKFDELH